MSNTDANPKVGDAMKHLICWLFGHIEPTWDSEVSIEYTEDKAIAMFQKFQKCTRCGKIF